MPGAGPGSSAGEVGPEAVLGGSGAGEGGKGANGSGGGGKNSSSGGGGKGSSGGGKKGSTGGGGKGGDKKKTNCMVCSRTTNKVPSNKEGGVQCSGCDLWWHPACAQMSQEKFQLILLWLKESQQSPWKCASCQGHEAKLMKLVTAVSVKVEDNARKLGEHDGRIGRVEDKSKLQEARLDTHERELRELREQVTKLGDMGGQGLMREMDERAAKENCLIFHRVREGGGEDALGRNNFDKQAIQHILNTIGVDVGVERGDIKNVRRLGARNSGGVGEEERGPRPILVVLAHRYHAESILGRSWVLSKAVNPEDREVSIVKDLTTKQRAREKEIYREVARKNLTRTREEVVDNMAYKVVGPRGSRREIFAPLRPGERVGLEGDVVWEREGVTGFSDRRRLRGGRRLGSAAATYPNSLAVGRPEGGTGWGQSQGTALGQTHGQSVPHQSLGLQGGGALGQGRGGLAPFGRGGGREAGGSRKTQGCADREGWQMVGRGGNTRTRAQLSPQGCGGPPGKRVDNRDSPPQASLRCSQPTSSPNRFAPLIDFSEDSPSREGGVDQWGDVVDDAVEVGVRVEGMGI